MEVEEVGLDDELDGEVRKIEWISLGTALQRLIDFIISFNNYSLDNAKAEELGSSRDLPSTSRGSEEAGAQDVQQLCHLELDVFSVVEAQVERSEESPTSI